MQATSTEALEAGKAFLKDAMEVSHLLLKRKLEALRRGEDVDINETREIVEDGQKTARQIQQTVSLEVRDRNVTLREEKARKEEAEAETEPEAHGEEPGFLSDDQKKFLAGMRMWQHGIWTRKDPSQPVPLPEPLKDLARKFRLDPDDQDTIDKLGDILMGVAEPVS